MIETTRLFLRPHALEDFNNFYAMSSDPAVMKFIAPEKPVTREEAWVKLLRNAGHWALLGYGLFVIFEKESGRFVGNTGLADFHRGLGGDFDPYPEAAWALAAWTHGKGYATEAAAAAHDWLAEQRKPSRTVCIIDPENTASLRVAEKLGYRRFDEVEYKEKTVIKLERLTVGAA
jgi:RimJ/RimL family protein N-acetyltransferase